jgi:cytochrome bd-type quinol oxidase subunit 1
VKRILKIFSFVILPLATLISFIIIGKINEQVIGAQEGSHRTMSGAISSIAWSYRGIFAMLLLIIFSFVLYSKLSRSVKIATLILMLIFNLPLMYFMELGIYFPLGLIVIPVVNLIALAPAVVEQAHSKNKLS